MGDRRRPDDDRGQQETLNGEHEPKPGLERGHIRLLPQAPGQSRRQPSGQRQARVCGDEEHPHWGIEQPDRFSAQDRADQ